MNSSPSLPLNSPQCSPEICPRNRGNPSGLLVITKAEMLNIHEACQRPRLHSNSRSGWRGFPDSP